MVAAQRAHAQGFSCSSPKIISLHAGHSPQPSGMSRLRTRFTVFFFPNSVMFQNPFLFAQDHQPRATVKTPPRPHRPP
jgi:hypothetical protein